MSATKAERLLRLADVQVRKRQLCEWRLAELARTGAALEAEIAAVIESLGSQSALSGLFLDQKVLTLRRKDGELAANREAQAAARAALQEATRLEKQLERVSAEASATQQRRDEADALAETLDAYLSRAVP